MLGKTHVMVGIAASLAIIQPSNMVDLVTAISGGAIGGWLCDIDCKDVSNDEGTIQGFALTAVVAGICVILDKLLGRGVCEYVVSHWGLKSIVAIAIFLIVCILGFLSSHRTFMHSILAVLLISGSLFIFCRPMVVPILIGLISHIFLDLFNGRGLQLFFPLDFDLCFDVCDSDGRANQVIKFSATIIAAILLGLFFVSNLSSVSNPLNNGAFARLPWFSPFTWYLLIVNAITFVVFIIDYLVCTRTNLVDDDDENYLHTFLNLFGVAGGVFGMLLSFIVLRQEIGKHNANWYAILISLLFAWIAIVAFTYDPFSLGIKEISMHPKDHLPLIIYLIVINLITVIAFLKDITSFRPKWTSSEFILFLFGIAGGALGGLITMIITNKKLHSPHFGFGFPILIASHTILIGYLLISGMA